MNAWNGRIATTRDHDISAHGLMILSSDSKKPAAMKLRAFLFSPLRDQNGKMMS